MRALICAVLLAGCATARETVVVIVRHAEKAKEPAADPPLTDAGAERARVLVEVVKDLRVQAIWSTGYARTRSTAAPLAAKLRLTTEILDAKPAEVARRLLEQHRGATVLVVGHSNTVTELVEALGAPKPPALCDVEYDNLYVVRVSAGGAASVDRRKYGAATACPAKD